MKKYLVVLLACAILISGCGPSEQAVQTAIAKTAFAQPTATKTLIPTSTPTLKPSPTLTITPVPTQAPALNSSYDDMRAKVESWTNAKFKYVYEIHGLRAYEGRDLVTGLYIYLLESDGNAAGFILSISDSPLFDREKEMLNAFQIMTYYISTDLINWTNENWPQEIGESKIEQFTTDTGEVMVNLKKEDETNYTITVIDRKYLE